MGRRATLDTWLAWISLAFSARCCVAATSHKWPLNLQLTPKASGMQGLRNVYCVDITVGRVGPLSLLVDTGSPAVVVQNDFGEAPPASSNFLGTDSADTATIHYGGSTVSGDISRSRTCFDKSDACLENFPVFEVRKGDAGFSQLGLDGVLGLGPASGEKNLALKGMDMTVLDGLASAGSGAPRVFGLFASPGELYGPSMLSMGGYDATKILSGSELQYVPLAQPTTGRWEVTLQSLKLAPADGGAAVAVDVCAGKSDCRVLLDSGTAQVASVPQLLDGLGSMVGNSQSGDCASVMPDMHLEFSGGVIVKLGPEDYVLDKQMCSLAIEEMSSQEMSHAKSLALILGEPFFRKVYAVFDQDQGRVGLAPSAAADKRTRNEQQRADEKRERAEHGAQSLMNYIR